MPPKRRSARLKRTKAAAAASSGVDRFVTREKKLREINPRQHKRSSSADLQLEMSGIWSDDIKLQLDATTQLLNLVSVEDNPVIDEVVQLGAVPRLVEFLKSHDYPQLQCEAARVLKSIATENTEVVIDSGAVPLFVKLLESSVLETCVQAAWSLGNIAGESVTCRDVVLNGGALHPLLTLFEKHNDLSFLRIGTWTLANMFEGGPQIPSEQLEFAMRILASLLLTKDEAALKEACWALLNLSRCGSGIGTAMYEADICSKLMDLFEHTPLSVLFPAMRAINLILRGSENHDKHGENPEKDVATYYLTLVVLPSKGWKYAWENRTILVNNLFFKRTVVVEYKLYDHIHRADLDAYFKEDKRCYARYLAESRKIIASVDSAMEELAIKRKRQSKRTCNCKCTCGVAKI